MSRPSPTLACLGVTLLLAACRVSPPISIGQRESMIGQGKVLTVTNTSDEYLHEIAVTVEAPDGVVKTYSAATLEPHESISVGWLKLDGWPIPEGAEVTVSCKGYPASAGPYRVQP